MSCSLIFFQLLNNKFKLREQLNLPGNVRRFKVLFSNYMLQGFVVHGVCFMVALSIAVLTRSAGECKLALWWRCRARWKDERYTLCFSFVLVPKRVLTETVLVPYRYGQWDMHFCCQLSWWRNGVLVPRVTQLENDGMWFRLTEFYGEFYVLRSIENISGTHPPTR
jgi:hypothetical protein